MLQILLNNSIAKLWEYVEPPSPPFPPHFRFSTIFASPLMKVPQCVNMNKERGERKGKETERRKREGKERNGREREKREGRERGKKEMGEKGKRDRGEKGERK